MKVSSSKEIILKKIRQALVNPVPVPFPGSEGNNSVFQKQSEELSVQFAQEFTKLLGKFAFCVDIQDFIVQYTQLVHEKKWEKIYCIEEELLKIISSSDSQNITQSSLSDCDASVTSCEYLIARTGSMVMSSKSNSGRSVSVYAPIHICIAYSYQLIYDIKDALLLIKKKYKNNIPSMITFATGPSRTADIEKTLVVGVHGPKEVYLFLIDDPAHQH